MLLVIHTCCKWPLPYQHVGGILWSNWFARLQPPRRGSRGGEVYGEERRGMTSVAHPGTALQGSFWTRYLWGAGLSRLPLEGTQKSWALPVCLHCTLTRPPLSWSKQMTGSQWIWHGRRWFCRATWAELIRFWMAPQWWPLFLSPWKDILTSHSPFGCLALSLGKTIFWGGWGQKNKNFVNSSGFILWEFAVRRLIWSHSPFFLFAFLTAYYIKPVYLHKEKSQQTVHVQYSIFV